MQYSYYTWSDPAIDTHVFYKQIAEVKGEISTAILAYLYIARIWDQ